MSDDFELNYSDLRKKRGANGHSDHWKSSGTRAQRRRAESRSSRLIDAPPLSEGAPADSDGIRFPFDPWRLVDAIARRWKLIVAGAAASAMLAFFVGLSIATYAVHVPLIERQVPVFVSRSDGGEPYSPRRLSLETLSSLTKSPQLLQTVSAKANVPVSPNKLAGMASVVPTRNPEIIAVQLNTTGDPKMAADLANLYTVELLEYLRRLQADEAKEVNELLKKKIQETEADLELENQKLAAFSKEAELLDVEREMETYHTQLGTVGSRYATAEIDLELIDLKIAALERQMTNQVPGTERLQAARAKLDDLLLSYKPAHPAVKAQQEEIAVLERRMQKDATGSDVPLLDSHSKAISDRIAELKAQKLALQTELERLGERREQTRSRISGLSQNAVRYAMIKGRIDALEKLRTTLAARQKEAQLYEQDAFGHYDVFRPVTPDGINTTSRWLKVIVISGLGGLLGFVMMTGFVLVSEVKDDRIKTAGDVRRVTNLPVLASLGDLNEMDADELDDWAFRTLTILRGKLNCNKNQSMVCGFISAQEGEGRSTWINLLVKAASDRGLRVLTVDTRPAPHVEPPEAPSEDEQPGDMAEMDGERRLLPVPSPRNLQSDVLEYPLQVRDQFRNSESQPVVHIPLPGWVWDVEGRKKWEYALSHWKKIENMFLLVELPPASEPEALLLAENLPQLIWLTGSGMVTARETKNHLETLRHGRCNLVGAVLNREERPRWRERASGWFASLNVLLVLFMAGWQAVAAEPGSPQPETSPSSRVVEERGFENESETKVSSIPARSGRLAPWQERLTLGPGDVLDFALFGYPELTRTNLFIGPDGRISYLQAQGVSAVGLTIDELRETFGNSLSNYYRVATVIITPVAYNSKKYYVLGKVNQPGAYILDRPITVLEAVARAGGIETGLVQLSTVDLADLSRSFLIRDGEKFEVDLEKLFFDGDLSQNIPLQPGDYLYFPSASANEVYVLGEVMNPGVVPYAPNTTLITAITATGGFMPKAYKKKILVVRGSLANPETYVIDAAAVLDARQPDFRLERTDIVYVSPRPWAKLQELLDEAGQAFVQAAVTTWAGVNVDPIIRKPFLK